MFLNHIKNYFLKRILKNNLHNVKSISSKNSIQTIGLLIDENFFSDKEALVKELIANGISEKNIKILVYKDKIDKNETLLPPECSIKDINWKAEITNSTINDFINDKLDLLISYYDVEEVLLLTITNNSKAIFKVGFSSIDKRLNHLIIKTNIENYTVFIHELFRYLKILNKI